MGRPRIGVILSGCGVQDGSEIHEAVITLLELARNGAEAVCLAPDIPQAQVVDHRTREPHEARRNVLTESARIARGKITDLAAAKAADLDAVILPGGLGAAKNLSDFASSGSRCRVNAHVEKLLLEMHGAGKPIGAICISPAVVARVFGGRGIPVRVTIGTDPATAAKIREMGGVHVDREVGQIALDETNRIVTTPAYMLGETIDSIAEGISTLVREVIRLTR